METSIFNQIFRMFLLATLVTCVVMLLVYTVQHPYMMFRLASIRWNGYVNP